MESYDKTLGDVIKEFDNESHLKTDGILTTVGYYIASQIFILILKGVNYYMEPHIASKFYKFFISNIFETILGIKVYIIQLFKIFPICQVDGPPAVR
jgi:hypothetical protein